LSLQKELQGKVVLVDFWTYSCINCIRTLPYLRDWYGKYKDKNFVIVGVHSPEFEFEKSKENVAQAIKDFGLEYPVVQDNNFTIWNAYQNQYWPAHYLIDKNGYIRYVHFGEGKYAETENAVRMLLDETPLPTSGEVSQPQPLTPETYLGAKRAASYSPQQQIDLTQPKNYSFVGNLEDDGVALQGTWEITDEYIVSDSDGSILLNFDASKAYLVLEPEKGSTLPLKVTVELDGQPLPASYYTQDMNKSGQIEVTKPRKYDLVDLKQSTGRHLLQIKVPKGIRAFAFTFG
jgi:thiol-disulfide isomerase/thioredoxin